MSILTRRQLLTNSAVALAAVALPVHASAAAQSFPTLSAIQRHDKERKQLEELQIMLWDEFDRIRQSLPKLPSPRVFLNPDLGYEYPMLSESTITSVCRIGRLDPAPYLAEFRARAAVRAAFLNPPELQKVKQELDEVIRAIDEAELGVIDTPSRDLADVATKAALLAEWVEIDVDDGRKERLTVIVAEEVSRHDIRGAKPGS